MKKVYIVGIGIGSKDFLHKRAIDTIDKCHILMGAERMLKGFAHLNKDTFKCIDSASMYEYIKNDMEHESFAVLVSGDTGFYSLSKKLTELLLENNVAQVENIPAIGSLQYFSSKLNLSWDKLKYVSAHGRKLNIVSNVIFNDKVFMLTDKDLSPDKICRILTDKGLGHLKVSVGENLSYDNERIIQDRADNIASMKFESLAVIIVHNDNPISPDDVNRSIRDEEFITGPAPITKSEIRTISVGKLGLREDYTVYDIGAGTGSVSIEAALKLSNGTLYAIEKDLDAYELIKENIKKFKTYNIEVINDTAPKGLESLPAPDACFIGGSSGNMDEIMAMVLEKNPTVKIVINTITLESLNEALECMKKYHLEDVEIVNVSVARSREVGRYHMMMAQNPIYIISGRGKG